MAISFPLPVASLADLIRIRGVTWMLEDNTVVSGTGGGDLLAKQMAPRLWKAKIQSAPYMIAEANQMQARIESLDGASNKFYLYNPLAPYPQSDPTGSILGSTNPTIHTLNSNNKEMRITGLPSTYVLTMGDMISWVYATNRQALHRIVSTVTAVAGLTPLFEVRPHIRTGSITTTVVKLIKPVGLFMLVPESFEISLNDDLKTCSFSLEARQTLK